MQMSLLDNTIQALEFAKSMTLLFQIRNYILILFFRLKISARLIVEFVMFLCE